jgi:thermostable 8-oxoguanine DNA glycosylase
MIQIGNQYIRDWASQYDDPNVGGDEADYNLILAKVSDEMSHIGTLSQETFTQVMDWKASRAKGKVNWDDFASYQRIIKYATEAHDEIKLAILCSLDGVGVPVASTILHFIYPNRFSIVDYRVTEVLYDAGKLTSHSITQSSYKVYMRLIMDICDEIACDIRNLDRALFACHKTFY